MVRIVSFPIYDNVDIYATTFIVLASNVTMTYPKDGPFPPKDTPGGDRTAVIVSYRYYLRRCLNILQRERCATKSCQYAPWVLAAVPQRTEVVQSEED